MRFTDDEGRLLELHVTDFCDVDMTDRLFCDVGEPDTVGYHRVFDVRETLGTALAMARDPDPRFGRPVKTSYRLADDDGRVSSGWQRTGGDMLACTPDLTISVQNGVRSVSLTGREDEWNR